jgi:hypothetical protein
VTRKLNERQLEGRVKNAVAQLLDKRLSVPKVFIEPKWPTQHPRVDVLAIDHAGTGDIHCVEVKRNMESARPVFPILKSMPAHFKYVAFFAEGDLASLRNGIDEVALYSDDGIGRLGVIVASEHPTEKVMQAAVIIEPERFRIDKKYYRLIDKFIGSHTADLEIRQ